MRFTPLAIPDVVLVEPDVFEDERGFFLETWHARRWHTEGGLPERFVQDNQSFSVRGVLRGLHAQLRHPQGKLVRAVQGEIFDVAVDLRPGSPSFGRWVGEALSDRNFRQLYVPPGFAHGFCVIGESATVQYKCTELYHREDEIGVIWNDPEIGIDWPVEEPRVSAKDQALPRLRELAEILQPSDPHEPRHP